MSSTLAVFAGHVVLGPPVCYGCALPCVAGSSLGDQARGEGRPLALPGPALTRLDLNTLTDQVHL